MKKRSLISLIICLCMMVNFVTVVHADGELVTQKRIIGNNVTVSGYGDDVNIFLLNPGKTVADLNNAVTDAEFDAVVNYCNLITTGLSKRYSDTFEIMNADEIEIVGLVTNICVMSNALMLKALRPEAKISVNLNCTAATSDEAFKASIEIFKSCQVELIGG